MLARTSGSSRWRFIPAAAAFAGILGSGEAPAQERLAAWTNQRSGSAAANNDFGERVARLGDVNGDGIGDVLVSSPPEDDGVAPYDRTHFGAVRVLSGADGSILRKHLGPEPAGQYGIGIAAGSDLDGDQVGDYVIASYLLPNYMTGPTEGIADVYSGATGALLHALKGELDGDGFGSHVRFLGDVDADGVDDLGVGAEWVDASPTKPQSGRVYVYSGRTATVLYRITGLKAMEFMGTINGVGDVNADGHADFAVGSCGFNAGPNGEGKVSVHSGATGKKLYTLVGENPGDGFGSNLCPLGDVNADGATEFAVWGPGAPSLAEGRVYVYTGFSGALLYTIDGTLQNQQLGQLSQSGPTDINGDGFDDVILGTSYYLGSGKSESKLQFHDGRNGRLLHEIIGETTKGGSTESIGASSDALGDINGDGFDDILVGAPGWNAAEGRVYVYAGNDLFLQVAPTDARVGNTVKADLRGGPPGSLGLIALVDVAGTPVFESLLLTTFDVHGEIQASATLDPSTTGLDFTVVGYGMNRSGRGPLMDSLRVTITVQ